VAGHQKNKFGHWGIVDCSFTPAKGFIKVIESESASIILPIIKNHVRPGSIIYTDEAKVYQSLKNNVNYEHKSIVHKYNFVDYENLVHTQNIESYNNKIKLRIKKMKGIKKSAIEDFLNEFMWLDNFKENCFEKTLSLFKLN
jgi:transposase